MFTPEEISKWMSACRKAVIVKATKGEYVDRLSQPHRLHPCPDRSPDVVVGNGLVSPDLATPDLATEDLGCLPPTSPSADHTTRSRREAHLAHLKLPTEPKVGYQHPVPS